jgi:hypothetical protein
MESDEFAFIFTYVLKENSRFFVISRKYYLYYKIFLDTNIAAFPNIPNTKTQKSKPRHSNSLFVY